MVETEENGVFHGAVTSKSAKKKFVEPKVLKDAFKNKSSLDKLKLRQSVNRIRLIKQRMK